MKKFALPIIALVIAAVPAGAYAANVGVNANATTSTNVTAGKTSTSTSAGVSVNASLSNKSNFTDVVGTLSNANTSASIDFSTIQTKHIKFVLVSKLKGYTKASLTLSGDSAKNRTTLDANVAADASLTAALKKHGYLPSDVLAVSTDAKGNLTVFIDK